MMNLQCLVSAVPDSGSETKDEKPQVQETKDASTNSTKSPVPLTKEELAAMIARLPELKSEEQDVKDFFKREASIKVPKTGTITKVPFPPPPENRAEEK